MLRKQGRRGRLLAIRTCRSSRRCASTLRSRRACALTADALARLRRVLLATDHDALRLRADPEARATDRGHARRLSRAGAKRREGLTHAPVPAPDPRPQDPLRPGGLRPHRRKPLRRDREARRARRAGRRVRRRSRRRSPPRRSAPAPSGYGQPRRACSRTARPTSSSSRRRAGCIPTRRSQIAQRRPPRDDREADGDALGGRQAHGRGLRQGRRAALRRQAEPPQRHAAAAQARGRQGALRPDLHGDHQRVLDAGRSPTTTARRGAAPGSSTAAPS